MEADLRVYELHAALCQTLANPVRLRILDSLRNGEKSVNELVELLGMPQANVSQHLAILRERNVVVTRREGVSILYSIPNPKIIRACELIREVLFEQLEESQQLARHYAKTHG